MKQFQQDFKNKKRLLFWLIWFPGWACAQSAVNPNNTNSNQTIKKIYVKLYPQPENARILRKISFPTSFKSLPIAKQWVTNFIQKLHKNAHLSARIDSMQVYSDTLKAFVYIGNQFVWGNLKKGNIPVEIVNNVGFKAKYYKQKPFLYKSIVKLQNKILTYSEDHGYPFAQLRLDSITTTAQQIEAQWLYKKGPLIIFDTLRIRGNLRIKPAFLAKYLRLKEGDIFSQNKVKKAEKILRQLPYAKVKQAPKVEFEAKKAYVNLFLQKRKSNQINLLIGILPNERSPNTLEWTGEFDLLLQNLFGSGKNLLAKWLRPEPQSQLINLAYTHPFLFQSNVDFQVKFNLLKEDTTFVNLNLGGNLSYNLSNGDKTSINFTSKSSRVLSNSIYQNITRLPDTLDVSFIAYGVGYEHSNLNDALYPTQGNQFQVSLEVGQKNILRNPELPDELYKNIPLNTTQFVYRGKWQHYLKLNQKSVFYWQLNTGALFNNQLLVNELFRLGGVNNLRGHNQNVLLASGYAIVNLEYRILFDEFSYFFMFYDQSWLRQKTLNTFAEDIPLGFGLGLNFPTQAGIFNIVYALGQTKDQPISFNRSKIHFGFISRF